MDYSLDKYQGKNIMSASASKPTSTIIELFETAKKYLGKEDKDDKNNKKESQARGVLLLQLLEAFISNALRPHEKTFNAAVKEAFEQYNETTGRKQPSLFEKACLSRFSQAASPEEKVSTTPDAEPKAQTASSNEEKKPAPAAQTEDKNSIGSETKDQRSTDCAERDQSTSMSMATQGPTGKPGLGAEAPAGTPPSLTINT